jgi:hypothetical protein
MGDWIDELGDDDEQRRKTEERHNRLQFHRYDVVRQKKPELWASLMNVINRDVGKFRTKFAGRRTIEFTDIPGLGFRLYKTPFPTVLMDAEIPLNETSMKVSYTTRFTHASPMERSEESFELTVDNSDNLIIMHNGRVFSDLDEVSRFLLLPVFTVEER